MTAPAHPDLWSFANRCYAQPGIAAECLDWQAQGADICLLLCAAWLEQRAVDWQPTRQAELISIAQPWQATVVVPLRALRQAWKAPAIQDQALAALRQQLQRLELAAERQLLERLDACSRDWSGGETPARWLEPLLGSIATPAARARLRAAATQAYSVV